MSTAQWPDIHLVWIDQYPIKYLSTSHISRHWYDGGSCLISSVRHCVSPLTLWWWWLWITVVLLSDFWWIYCAVSMCVQYEVDNFLQINQKKKPYSDRKKNEFIWQNTKSLFLILHSHIVQTYGLWNLIFPASSYQFTCTFDPRSRRWPLHDLWNGSVHNNGVIDHCLQSSMEKSKL